MANLTTVQPFDFQTGFNDMVVRAQRVTNDDISVVYLDVRNDATNTVTTLQRIWINSYALFNIGDVVKFFFNYKYQTTLYLKWVGTTYNSGSIINDRGMSIQYSYRVRSGSNTGEWITKNAFNAVTQFENGNVDMSSLRGKLLTRQKKIIKYPGLPLVLSFLNFPDGLCWIYVDGQELDNNQAWFLGLTYEFMPVTLKHFNLVIPDGASKIELANNQLFGDLLLADNSNNLITTNDGDNIIITVVPPEGTMITDQVIDPFNCNFDEDTFYNRYFYVRWINDIGGWEYAMFTYRQTDEHQMKKQTTFTDYTPRNFVMSSEQAINKELVRTLTVGMEGIDKDEFNRVRGILKSPVIQTYSATRKTSQLAAGQAGQLFNETDMVQAYTDGDGYLGWVPITVNKGDFEKDTREIMQECEVTFNLPPTKIQF